MSLLSTNSLQSLQLPLSACQQWAEIRFLQGQYNATTTPSSDLLAAMATKSRLAAVESFKPSNADFNYRQALVQLDTPPGPALSADQGEITHQYIVQLHRLLHSKGGQWRSVKMHWPQPLARYGTPSLLVGKTNILPAINLLLRELHQALAQGFEPLVVIPLFAKGLLQLFPFIDGNRRIVLLLTRFLLGRNGHEVVNYIDLESECNATTRVFYRSLNQAQDATAWLSYWWVIVRRLYQRYQRQIEQLNIPAGRGSKTALVERFVRAQQQPFRARQVSEAFPTISGDQIRLVLRSLRDRNIIRAEGRGRAARWTKTPVTNRQRP